METRRLFLAALLSLIVVIIWGQIFRPPEVIPPPAEGDDPVAVAEPSGPHPAEAPPPVAVPPEAAAVEERERPTLPEVVAPHETPVVIDEELYRAELTNRGGQLVSFRLKRDLSTDGEPLELVRERGADPYPLALFDPQDRPHPLNDALFVVEQRPGGEVRFRYRGPAGEAEKILRFQPSGLVDLEIRMPGAAGWSVLFGPGLRNPDDLDSSLLLRMAAYSRGEESETLVPKKQDEDVVLPAAGLRWATLEDNYFLNAVIPQLGAQEVVIRPLLQRPEVERGARRFVERGSVPDDDGLDHVQEILVRSAGERLELTSFFGAKRYRDLVALPYGLDQTVRWGFFGFLARPLYFGLEWIYQRVPNYGWAIVLMTFVIKLIFFPLTHKSQKSMAKMQELSPKIQALRARYRPKLKDRQGRPNPDAQRQMNEEMMALYRKAGVNPASGCLPILIQIPVFFAFFRLLSTAVELRNAPWVLWVKDLSTPDGFYLLPVAMLATSILLQRMTPPPPDPMQRRMMQLFPIMFGVLAVTFPSGLVLYWTTNNVLTMAQQAYYLQSKKRDKKTAAARDKKKEGPPAPGPGRSSGEGSSSGKGGHAKPAAKKHASAGAKIGSRRRR